MLTRSHARALASKEAAVAGHMVVSPSATGKGTHIRWTYPDEEDDTPFNQPITRTHILPHIVATSSHSSIPSSSILTPDASFDTGASLPVTPHRDNKLLTTPPRLSPRKLQRSPRGRWTMENGATRLVFVEESAEQAKLRAMQDEAKCQEIEERELENLLRERDIAREEEDFVMDDETRIGDEASSADATEVMTDEGMGARLGLTPGASLTAGQARPLGPNGTELVDPVTFMPYPSHDQASRIETWRLGVL
ncbi:hypothetical protein C0995_006102 [Termitomyces sp. Mi166|nr:hypothetical protein C0995_006102 [Termitomyces sp. Mi166\